MEITYFGHSMFLMKASDGTSIVTDPFSGVSYEFPKDLEVDIAVVSHDHFDHDAVSSLKGCKHKVTAASNVLGITFETILTSHGPGRGNNNITKFILDGITIAHLGDLGTSLTEDEVSKLKGIDVILVPVGGGFTIDAKEADDLIKAVQPKVAIPMHYGSFPMIASIDDFQNLSSIPIKKKDHTVNISQSTLPSDTEVWELAISPELP